MHKNSRRDANDDSEVAIKKESKIEISSEPFTMLMPSPRKHCNCVRLIPTANNEEVTIQSFHISFATFWHHIFIECIESQLCFTVVVVIMLPHPNAHLPIHVSHNRCSIYVTYSMPVNVRVQLFVCRAN